LVGDSVSDGIVSDTELLSLWLGSVVVAVEEWVDVGRVYETV